MTLRNKKIVLTGGAGFIGSAMVGRLADDNQIVILDNLRRNSLKDRPWANHKNVELVTGDVRDADLVTQTIKGATHVVHLASIAGVDTVLKYPVETMEIALVGTMNVLRACQGQTSIERVIDFSTSEVFGQYAYKVSEGNVTTLGAVGEARWTYAVSKLATEHLAHNYYTQHGVPTVSIRPFNIFGPGQVGEGAIHHFVRRAITGEPLKIHNDGSQIRSWCYIDDILDGIELALEKESAIGHSFNVGNPRATVTVFQLAEQIVEIAGSSSPINFVEWPHADVELRIPDIQKAKNLLGFEPKVELKDGLARTIKWYREKMA